MATNVGARIREFPVVKEAAAETKVAAGARLAFIDNLRVFLTILVVIHHLAITYGAGGSWYYQERPTTMLAEVVLSLFTGLNHFYFMGLFFLISGYFTPAALDRKGSWRFLKDRLVRLGIPLVLYMLLINSVPLYFNGIHEGWWNGNFGQFLLAYWREGDYGTGPLWFVEALLIFSLVYIVGRVIFRRIKPGQGKPLSQSQQPLTHGRILGLILAIALLSFAVRLVFPLEAAWHNLQFANFPQYIFLFAAGILAYRCGWLPDLPSKIKRTWSAAAVLAIVVFPPLMIWAEVSGNSDLFKGGITWQSMLTSTWEAVYCISMSILMLSVFRLRFDEQDRLGRLLSRNAYTVYIIHAPLIVTLAYLLREVSIDPLLKYILVAPLAVGLCFLAGHFLVRRIPLAEKVL